MSQGATRDWVTRRGFNWLAISLAGLFTLALALSGLSSSFESDLKSLRDGMFPRAASGDIAIVEIDGRSLQKIDRWPWPRSHFASAIEQLERQGVEQIAFDVDFSSPSIPFEDATFASALDRATVPVVLPTFRQINRGSRDDAISESLPLRQFREHALLASVNVHPQADGRIEYYPYGEVTAGTPRPSFASLLADRGGSISDSFRIDHSVLPDTIPRISFVDLVEGRVERERIEGKIAVIGATAIELGDRYPTARHGVRPGVTIQVLAAETLRQDLLRIDSGPLVPTLLVAIALTIACVWKSGRFVPHVGAVAGNMLVVTAAAFDWLGLPYIQLVAPILFLAGFLIARALLKIVLGLREATLTDFRSGLANAHAFQVAIARASATRIAIARFDDLDQVEAIVASSELGDLDGQIARRFAVLAEDQRVYRLERGLFGWVVPAEYEDCLEDHFSAAKALFNSAFRIGERQVRLLPYFGYSDISLDNAKTASEAARRARICWSSSAQELQQRSQFEQQILLEIDEAIANGDLWVAFQPKLVIASGRIGSAECLVRWNHRTLGEVSPEDFIAVLEQRGRTDQLTRFVIDQSIARLKEAREKGWDLSLAVNMSAHLLSDAQFITDIVALFEQERTLLSRGALTLEVTESAPLDDPDIAQIALGRLHAAGARISLDDYGTGQATLTYLQEFPADEVKLDRSFVSRLDASRSDHILVSSTIEMAHALGFEVVAEGVEHEATLEILRSLGCDYAQGWHIGRPVRWEMFVVEHAFETGPLEEPEPRVANG